VPHPNLIPGNDAIRLITPEGEDTDELDGRMAPTAELLACPNILKVMEVLGATWGRSRLMGLAAGSQVPVHIDSAYYWRTHLRIHIPVITNPAVTFTCGGESVHMAPGECWIFDSFQPHEVHNDGDQHRVHLVLDTVGGGPLADLITAAASNPPTQSEIIPPGPGNAGQLAFERVNSPKVMTPWEMRAHFEYLLKRTRKHDLTERVSARLDRLAFEWGGLWASYGDSDEGIPRYRQQLVRAGRDLSEIGGSAISLNNGVNLYHVLGRMVLSVAVAPDRPVEQPQEGPEAQALAS
jgi:hypothetical protein